MDTVCNTFGYPKRAVPAFKTALWGVDLYHTGFVLEESPHYGLAEVPLLRDFLHRIVGLECIGHVSKPRFCDLPQVTVFRSAHSEVPGSAVHNQRYCWYFSGGIRSSTLTPLIAAASFSEARIMNEDNERLAMREAWTNMILVIGLG